MRKGPRMKSYRNLIPLQTEERIQRVLETARRLIAEKGYDGVNIRDLAFESRVSVPTLYKLLGDKNAILAAAMGDQFETLLRRIEAGSRSEGLDRVIAIVEGCSREMLKLEQYSRSVLSVLISSGQTAEVSRMIARALAGNLHSAVAGMRDQGQLESWVDTGVLARQLTGHLIFSCLQWQSGRLDGESLPPDMLNGAALVLLGVSRGRAREKLEGIVRNTQKALAARRTAAVTARPKLKRVQKS